MGDHDEDVMVTVASIEETLECRASSLRDVKGRMRPLFGQERVAASAATAAGDHGTGHSPSMLRNWRRVVRGGPARSQVAPSSVSTMPSLGDQASEIARLKRELDRTRMERDVLKKAIGIFAEVPK